MVAVSHTMATRIQEVLMGESVFPPLMNSVKKSIQDFCQSNIFSCSSKLNTDIANECDVVA